MFQTFDSQATPAQGPARLAALRQLLLASDLDGFIVPRADAHQGEYVAARDERLQWLTGFTGSAGFCIVLPSVAGVFIDGRYRTQIKGQVDLAHFTPVPWPEEKPGDWIRQHLTNSKIGYDPWLHSVDEIETLEKALAGSEVALSPVANCIDRIWQDQPAAPKGVAFVHPDTNAGESSLSKRARLAAGLVANGHRGAIITLPDSLCWLLNLRGADVPRNPILHGFALLEATGDVVLFVDPDKITPDVEAHLDEGVSHLSVNDFEAALTSATGQILVDRATAPIAVVTALGKSGAHVVLGEDPCRLAKAKKNAAEIAGMREAHLRDGAAVVEFLCWLDDEAPKNNLTEISVVRALEGFRRATNALHDISFDTICGAGPNGAIMHYRVTEQSNRVVGQNELLLVDSGGQYRDGTTDITRTIAIASEPGKL
jgi:Xaa-Pro aminopeptidase